MGRFAFFACSTSMLLACGASPDAAPERLAKVGDAIIGGTLDTTHQAVVALCDNYCFCTATIIAVSGSTGYALTAAHCLSSGADVVVQGNDFNSSSSIVYSVTDYQAHPSYNGQTYDFGMVAFTGADGSTPIIPAMSDAEDNLAAGSLVEFVGYGVTENSNNNSKRYTVDGQLSDVSALLIEYQQQDGGPCNGDSGGPSLSLVGGQERVSGVTSYGDQNCTQYGVSSRVSAAYDSFIVPFMNGGSSSSSSSSGGGQTCDECAQGSVSGNAECAGEWNGCLNDNDCYDFVVCLQDCGNDDACADGCVQSHQSGAQTYSTVIACICNDACGTECSAECSSSSSSSTTSTGSGPGATTGSGAGATTGGTTTGVGGAGSGTGAGAGTTGGDDDDSGLGDDDGEDRNLQLDNDSGCAVNPGTTGAPWTALGVGLMTALLGLLRRRRGD